MTLTVEDIHEERFPKANRFMVEFTSVHKLSYPKGEFCEQNQRRFVLADNIKDAEEHFMLELNNKELWDGVFNSWKDVKVKACPEAAVFVGYHRFEKDIRNKA